MKLLHDGRVESLEASLTGPHAPEKVAGTGAAHRRRSEGFGGVSEVAVAGLATGSGALIDRFGNLGSSELASTPVTQPDSGDSATGSLRSEASHMSTSTGRQPTDAVYLHPDDNMCVAARNLEKGQRAGHRRHVGHARRDVKHRPQDRRPADSPGRLRPQVRPDHRPGDRRTSHPATGSIRTTCVNGEFARDYATATAIPPPPHADRRAARSRAIAGASGRAGTRNYIGVISHGELLGHGRQVHRRAVSTERLRRLSRTSTASSPSRTRGGCGMQYRRLQHEMLDRTLARHRPASEHRRLSAHRPGLREGADGLPAASRRTWCRSTANGRSGKAMLPPVLSMQDLGGTAKTVEAGVKLARRAAAAGQRRRSASRFPPARSSSAPTAAAPTATAASPQPGPRRRVATCSSPPAARPSSPKRRRSTGPSTCSRAGRVTPAVGEKLIERIKWWEWYTGMFGVEINNNPSVGNKEGGLTTIYEKSLGAVAKAGTHGDGRRLPVRRAGHREGLRRDGHAGLRPGERDRHRRRRRNVVVFTTGRGSCFGCKPTPAIKVATNTPMYERMIDDMDINAGEILARPQRRRRRPRDLRGDPRRRQRREDEERAPRRRRRRVRAVADRADAVREGLSVW